MRDAGDARFRLAVWRGVGVLDGVLGDADFAGDADGFFEEFVGQDVGHRSGERVGDAVFVDGMRTEIGPAEKVFVPERHVVGVVGGLQILPVGFFHLPDFVLTGGEVLGDGGIHEKEKKGKSYGCAGGSVRHGDSLVGGLYNGLGESAFTTEGTEGTECAEK